MAITEPIKILIVDDDVDIIGLYMDILKDSGYLISAVANAHEAFNKIEQQKFDLILLDLKLPDMYGIDVLKELRELSANGGDAAVIIVTGNPTIESMLEAVRAGVDDYIIKPFHIDDFKISVKRVVEKIVLAKENQRLLKELDTVNRNLQENIFALQKIVDGQGSADDKIKLLVGQIARIKKAC